MTASANTMRIGGNDYRGFTYGGAVSASHGYQIPLGNTRWEFCPSLFVSKFSDPSVGDIPVGFRGTLGPRHTV